MAKRKGERASSVEAFLERHSPGYQYGWVLALLAMTFIVMAAGPPDGWTRIITVLLQGLTLCAALLASRVGLRLVPHRRTHLARVVARRHRLGRDRQRAQPERRVLPAQRAAGGHRAVGHRPGAVEAQDRRRAHRARCRVHLRPARACSSRSSTPPSTRCRAARSSCRRRNATTPDFLYFSYVTQTTVGYGDFTARGDLGRALAVLEAVSGQLYLVTVIAVLVSRMSGNALGHGARRRPHRRPAPT